MRFMKWSKLSFCMLLCFTLMAGTVFATEEDAELVLDWIEGGQTVQVGELSSLKLDESLLYLDKDNTVKAQQYFGNNVYGTEMGSVFPESEEESWFVLFEYEEVGYISDKDKNKIDAKELLDSYKRGTAESNKDRAEEHQLFVKDWHTKPYYDDTDRTLIWALLAEDFYGNPIINYNVRILTREGYVSVLLVTDPSTLDHDINALRTLILPNLEINSGFRYEDHDPSTDKISEVGLTGLILGGAGLVAAKKAGLLVAAAVLLKKFWFVLLAVPVAIWRFFRNRGRNKAEPETPYTDSSASASDQMAASDELTSQSSNLDTDTKNDPR